MQAIDPDPADRTDGKPRDGDEKPVISKNTRTHMGTKEQDGSAGNTLMEIAIVLPPIISMNQTNGMELAGEPRTNRS